MLCASSALAQNTRFIATPHPSPNNRYKETTTESHATKDGVRVAELAAGSGIA